MGWGAFFDKQALPLTRWIAERTAPDPDTLGYPLFSARIKDRMLRWRDGRQPNPYSAIGAKVDGQSYMRSLGYVVPEVYGIYPSIDALPRLDDLPRKFVLKPVQGWGAAGVFLMRDGVEWLSKRRLTRDALIDAAKAMTRHQNTRSKVEWIVEELLEHFDGPGHPAHDYKFFCFGPKVACVRIRNHVSRQDWECQSWVREPDWRPLPFRLKWGWYPDRSTPAKPPFFDKMLEIVSDVGGRLNIFIRIDMYATDHGPVFGEFTGYPSLGQGFTPRGDAWLGSHWKTLDGGIELPTSP